MEHVISGINHWIRELPQALGQMSEIETSHRPAPHKWSKRRLWDIYVIRQSIILPDSLRCSTRNNPMLSNRMIRTNGCRNNIIRIRRLKRY